MIPDWASERRRMVSTQLRRRGIRGQRVIGAMLTIPREEFVRPEDRISAYADEPVPIGGGQTISQPYMTALMAQTLQLEGSETVLEVGTGSGYAAAVLGALAARVISLELIPALADFARANLHRTGRDSNVTVIASDGSLGYAPGAPYDRISVAAAAPAIPAALLDQLGAVGLLVIPVGTREDQELRVVTRRGSRIEYRVATLCRFVPLLGGEGWQ